jgi:hypothetical protein
LSEMAMYELRCYRTVWIAPEKCAPPLLLNAERLRCRSRPGCAWMDETSADAVLSSHFSSRAMRGRPSSLRARFHGRLELDMRVQPALQRALLEYRLCRDCRDWRPNWISFSTQPIACLHENKVTAFLFCLPFCPQFPPVQASHGNAL